MLPKRGSKLCPSCGLSNGNRAYACKACHRSLYSDTSRTTERRSKQWCDVSRMTCGDDSGPHRLYSARVRERRPDYKTLVAAEASRSWMCYYESCRTAEETRLRSTPGAGSMSYYCEHIMTVKKDLDSLLSSHNDASLQKQMRELELNPHLLNEIAFPATVCESLQTMSSRGAHLIQRVSEEFLGSQPRTDASTSPGFAACMVLEKQKAEFSPTNSLLPLYSIQAVLECSVKWYSYNPLNIEMVFALLHLPLGFCFLQQTVTGICLLPPLPTELSRY